MIKLVTPLDQVDNPNPTYEVGTRVIVNGGNEYIYLPGIASCAAYDWIVFRTTGSGLSYGSVTRMGASGLSGQVGIAQGAVVGPAYGWFLIKGVGWGNFGVANASGGSPLFSCGTTAMVGTTRVSTHMVYGAFAVGAGVSSGTGKVFVDYPYYIGNTL